MYVKIITFDTCRFSAFFHFPKNFFILIDFFCFLWHSYF